MPAPVKIGNIYFEISGGSSTEKNNLYAILEAASIDPVARALFSVLNTDHNLTGDKVTIYISNAFPQAASTDLGPGGTNGNYRVSEASITINPTKIDNSVYYSPTDGQWHETTVTDTLYNEFGNLAAAINSQLKIPGGPEHDYPNTIFGWPLGLDGDYEEPNGSDPGNEHADDWQANWGIMETFSVAVQDYALAMLGMPPRQTEYNSLLLDPEGNPNPEHYTYFFEGGLEGSAFGNKDIWQVLPGYSPNLPQLNPAIDTIKGYMNLAEIYRPDPLVLDLNGNGQIDLNGAPTVYFDTDNDGLAEAVNWVSATDGLLARDINDNGKIDNGTELFGNATLDGFQVLKTLDTNSDFIINQNDAVWSDLVVWKDQNQNGVSEAGELLTLSSLGITKINLSSVVRNTTNPSITHDGVVTTSTGTMKISNVLFTADAANTRFVGDFSLDIELLALPQLKGYGKLADLYIAGSINTSVDAQGDTIKDKLVDLKDMSLVDMIDDLPAVQQKIETLLFHWAGAENISPTSRGTYMDARRLIFLEKYIANTFNPVFGVTNPELVQAKELNEAYTFILEKLTADILLQATAGKLFSVSAYNPYTDTVDAAKFVLSVDALDDLSGHASTLSTMAERAAFWIDVAGLIDSLSASVKNTGGRNELGLTMGEETKLNAAIVDSDASLNWQNIKVSYLENADFTTTGIHIPDASGTVGGTTFADKIIGQHTSDNISGFDGDDYLEGGRGGDAISGDGGNDQIFGDNATHDLYGGNDNIDGGAGNDFILGGMGNDTVLGGDGNDEIWGDYKPGNFNGSVYSGSDFLAGGLGEDIIYGGHGNDILVDGDGTTGQNLLDGGLGFNTYRIITGGAEVYIDQQDGGTGIIELTTGAINDLSFERLVDTLHITSTTPGALFSIYIDDHFLHPTRINKIYFATGGNIDLSIVPPGIITQGTAQNDNLAAAVRGEISPGVYNDYADVMYGYEGDDRISGDYGDDTLYGGDGNDNLSGDKGDDTLYGGDGNDTLTDGGTGEENYLYGGNGTDRLYFSSGDNYLDGGAGDDSYTDMLSNGGFNTFVASDGHDRVSVRTQTSSTILFQSGVTVNDLTFSRLASNLVITHLTGSITVQGYFATNNIQTLTFANNTTADLGTLVQFLENNGTNNADTISSSGNVDDIIYGLGGNDIISSGAGDDVIYGGDGNDTINAGDDDDVVYGGAGQDTINLGAGNDIVWGNVLDSNEDYDAHGVINGGDGNDEIHGRGELNGGNGDDTIYGDDTAYGEGEVNGDAGNDTIYASGLVDGGAGNDIIYYAGSGYEGGVTGGTGDDQIFGSRSRDNYYYNIGDGNDIIRDSRSDDSIYFGPGITIEDTIFTRVGDNLEITFTGNSTDKITIVDHYFRMLLDDGDIYDGMIESLFFETTGLHDLYYSANLIDPEAENDSFVMNQGTVLSGNLYADNGNGADSDADGDTLYLKDMSDLSPRRAESQLLTLNSGATVLILANGDFTYTPDVSFTGIDTFEYQILDSRLGLSSATVTITVDAANVAPQSESDIFDVTYSGTILGNVLSDNGNGADWDVNGDNVLVVETSITSTNGASITMSSNGDFIYTSVEGFWGADTFTYTLTDGVLTSTGTVTLNIGDPSLMIGTSGSDILVGTSFANEIYGHEGDDFLSGGAGNDTIDAGDGYNEIRGGAGDDTLIGGVEHDLYYYAAGDGTDTIEDVGDISYIYDGIFLENIDEEDVILTRVGYNLEITFAGNTTDKITVIGHYNSVENEISNRIENLYFGSYGNSLMLRNNSAEAVNDDFTINKGAVLNGNLFDDNGNGADYDTDGDEFYMTSPYSGDPANGEVFTTTNGATVVRYANGDFVYTPTSMFTGQDSFYYDLYDGTDYSAGLVTITVQNPNAAPDAKDDSFSVAHGQYGSNVTGNLLSNNGNGVDSDSDGGTLSIIETSVVSAQGVMVKMSANGNFTYYSSIGYIGTDTFSYTLSDGQGGTDTATVSVTISAPSGYTLGTSSDDTFNGASTADKYFGMNGNDTITGNGGNDELYGSGGNDTIYGNAGMDVLFGGTGTNYLYGGADNDSLFSENSADVLEGGTGSDTYRFTKPWTFAGMTIEDNGGSDNADAVYFYNLPSQMVPTYRLLSGNILDLVVNLAGYGELTIKNQFAQDGNDRIESVKYFTGFVGVSAYRDDAISVMPMTFEGSSGNDILTLPSYGLSTTTLPVSGHTIKGLDGDDTITGLTSADNLYGGNGNDTITGSHGNDILYGEDGNDTLYGGAGQDVMYGGSGTNYLYGGSENDSLYSISSSDTLEGGTGNDNYRFTVPSSLAGTVIEDNGVNTDTTDGVYVYSLTTQLLPTYRLLSGNSLDLIVSVPGYGEFTIKNQFAQDGADRIESVKYFTGSTGSAYRDDAITVMPMTFEGSSGNDTLNLPSYGLSAQTQLTAAHTIYGLDGNDTITGNTGADKLYGGNHNDTLNGGSGTDQLNGDAGSDTLIGGIGNDVLYGGSDDDIFMFTTMSGTDTIMDFSLAQNDKIDIADLLQGYNPLTHAITDFVQITTSGSNSILKVDVDGGANNFVQVATINGVTGLTDEAALVTSGNLIAT